jgi:hypothetical protein
MESPPESFCRNERIGFNIFGLVDRLVNLIEICRTRKKSIKHAGKVVCVAMASKPTMPTCAMAIARRRNELPQRRPDLPSQLATSPGAASEAGTCTIALPAMRFKNKD